MKGNIYAVNQEGIMALKTMSAAIISSCESIEQDAASLLRAAQDRENTLGPHYKDIEEVVKTIQSAVNDAKEPATGISQRLNKVAEGYANIIANSKIKNAGN